MKRFNLKLKQSQGTLYSKTGLLCQLVPSLEMTFALRMLFDIPGGEGRILNMDESQSYRYNESSRAWTFHTNKFYYVRRFKTNFARLRPNNPPP